MLVTMLEKDKAAGVYLETLETYVMGLSAKMLNGFLSLN